MTEKSEKTLGLIIIVATVLVATMTAIFAQMNKGSYESTERQSEIQTLLPDKKGGQLEFYGSKPKRGGDSSGDIMRQALREFYNENPQYFYRYKRITPSSEYEQGYEAGYSDAIEEMEGRIEEMEERIDAMED